MRSARFARAIVRLYPRRWRARYEEEMLALLGETTITPATALNLVGGAVREWFHVIVAPPEPFSLDQEFWQNFRRSIAGAILIAAASWGLARLVLRFDTPSDDNRPLLMLGSIYVVFKGLFLQIRRNRIASRAAKASLPRPSAAIVASGIGRAEFWMCVAFLAISASTNWTRHDFTLQYPRFELGINWMMFWFFVGGLLGSTRRALAKHEILLGSSRP